ncbi:MAG TPA: hypothetical protein PKD24_10350 [Pyrinomonadaceae bacterium]|nr:hypothetical protein [Pyrinomonadaceae bacterium]HMP65582.1 hypothetical protein [Pyrinomonadaceae bacterium]
MSSRNACHKCGRELRGAVETHYMSLARLVCFTAIETPDCNWMRCRVCKKAVCKSCYLAVEAMCARCFVSKQYPLKSNTGGGNGPKPDGPTQPFPFKKAA